MQLPQGYSAQWNTRYKPKIAISLLALMLLILGPIFSFGNQDEKSASLSAGKDKGKSTAMSASKSKLSNQADGIAEGQKLFAKSCKCCHGADGQGIRGKKRLAEIPDFRDAAWQAERSDIQLRISLREGLGKSMPAFQGRLNEEQIEELIAYVRSFAPNSKPKRKSPENAFDIRFRELEAELKELQRQFWEFDRQADDAK